MSDDDKKKPEPKKKTSRHRYVRAIEFSRDTDLRAICEEMWPRKDATDRTWVLEGIQHAKQSIPGDTTLELHDNRGSVGEIPAELLRAAPWTLNLQVDNGLRLLVCGGDPRRTIMLTVQVLATTVDDV